jgi:hypothetical protein
MSLKTLPSFKSFTKIKLNQFSIKSNILLTTANNNNNNNKNLPRMAVSLVKLFRLLFLKIIINFIIKFSFFFV